MPMLAEIQCRMRNAIVHGDTSHVAPLLREGEDSAGRFAIHRRNYETSLVDALLTKYPATVWFVGTRFVTEAAVRFVHQQPPTAPCIAEYGVEFPQFLSMLPSAERVPYLRDFAALEWYVGQASIATSSPPLAAEHLSSCEGHAWGETEALGHTSTLPQETECLIWRLSLSRNDPGAAGRRNGRGPGGQGETFQDSS
jgi:Putative DNA-binding domain